VKIFFTNHSEQLTTDMTPSSFSPIRGFSLPVLLTASAILAVIAISGYELANSTLNTDASIRIEPRIDAVEVGGTFTVRVVVQSRVSLNAFAGVLTFNPSVLAVDSIDYNTSIADLWALEPWYSNGDGTVSFGGGTTRAGGFNGEGDLITVTFKAIGEGDGSVILRNPLLLKHDGLGTGVPVIEPIDSMLTVTTPTNARGPGSESRVAVVKEAPSADLNNDGAVTFTDASIMMLHLFGDEPRYDFNLDGRVNASDLELLMQKTK
jgi:hypothetical protein